jgi:hypothetical protein
MLMKIVGYDLEDVPADKTSNMCRLLRLYVRIADEHDKEYRFHVSVFPTKVGVWDDSSFGGPELGEVDLVFEHK